MWNVKPGDLVVYVGPPDQTDIYLGRPNKAPLVYGEIYTVSGLKSIETGELVLELEERQLFFVAGMPWGWRIRWFRPVAKPSIENLRSLIKNPDPVSVDA